MNHKRYILGTLSQVWDLKNVTELTGKIVVIRPEWSGRKKLEEGWIKDVKVHLARKSLNVL